MSQAESIESLKKELESLREKISIVTAYTTVVAMDSAGLHELCNALAEGKDVPHGSDRIKKILKLVRLTTWPEDLQSRSLELKNILTEMANAFDTAKKQTVQEFAPRMHAAYHGLCNLFYDWMAKPSST